MIVSNYDLLNAERKIIALKMYKDLVFRKTTFLGPSGKDWSGNERFEILNNEPTSSETVCYLTIEEAIIFSDFIYEYLYNHKIENDQTVISRLDNE